MLVNIPAPWILWEYILSFISRFATFDYRLPQSIDIDDYATGWCPPVKLVYKPNSLVCLIYHKP